MSEISDNFDLEREKKHQFIDKILVMKNVQFSFWVR